MSEPKDFKYEDALKRLEKIVAELGKPEVELDTRLRKFEEGTKLARLLLKRLDQAKKKVELLIKNQVGDLTAVPFDDDEHGNTTPA